jgi:hypothetical protein
MFSVQQQEEQSLYVWSKTIYFWTPITTTTTTTTYLKQQRELYRAIDRVID